MLFSKKKDNSTFIEDTPLTNSNNDEIKELSREIQTSVASIKNKTKNLSTEDIYTAASKISDYTNTESSDLDSTIDSMDKFNNEMEGLSQNINDVHGLVINTSKLADDGLTNMNTLDSSLNELKDSFSTSASIVSDLVSKIESVNSITDSISQIASQTNLLALNAAIEAARAGEAGKGFGVVADEIRKLAESSKNAVENITTILDEIKKDIMNTSSAMNSAGDAIELQNNTVQTTKETFTSIKTSIDDTVSQIKSSVNSVNSSTSVRTDIGAKMHSIRESSEKCNLEVNSILSSIDSFKDNIKDITSSLDQLTKQTNSLLNK
ncbi:methyl-accepting chemotaxis protein [uncultured Clostridium sp.]|uniref:methyl-accepting chemotaxis protein n=1 Tax=uncultured Clostridium sp. TaxID=59620 RepID=UPI0025F3E45F|nr:methyl-accepting chemotaxis protein [uncultured Clostridium sp.]